MVLYPVRHVCVCVTVFMYCWLMAEFVHLLLFLQSKLIVFLDHEIGLLALKFLSVLLTSLLMLKTDNLFMK